MTGTSVSQAALLKGMQKMSAVSGRQQETTADFGALLSQTSNGSAKEPYDWTKGLGNLFEVKSDNQSVYQAETAKGSYKDITVKESSSRDIQNKLPKDADQKLEDFENQMKDVLEEELGVSEEELVQAMEELGLTMLDLTQPANLAQLVMQLTGSQDGCELLLSPHFQALLVQVEEVSAELLTELNLTSEEFSQMMEQLENLSTKQPEENVIKDEAVVLQPEEAAAQQPGVTETQQSKESTTDADKITDIVVNETADDQAAEVQGKAEKVISEESAGESEEDNTIASKTVTQDAQESEGQELSEDNNGQKENLNTKADAGAEKTPKQQQQNPISYQSTVQTINQGQNVELVQTVTQTKIDVESLMRQISQMTKISISQAQSSIEMQLNPANLGKVYLQVIAKDGAVTAQLAAQNEAVKEALESQIVTLRENMAQQGMKVEAIEVTVASHEFERNLEQNQQNPSQEQQEAEMRKGARRSINMNHLDDLEGLMSEEENLAAKMMSDNGNSVDFTA